MDLYINGDKVEMQWKVEPLSPKRFFRGFSELWIRGEGEKFDASFTLLLPNNGKTSMQKMYIDSDEALGTFVLDESQEHNISVTHELYAQPWKRLEFKSTVQMPESTFKFEKMPWNDDDKPLLVEIKNGLIDINSDVIYKRSTKGGADRL